MSDTTRWLEAAAPALDVLNRAGGDFADVYIEENRSVRVRIENSQPDQVIDGGEFGAGLRLVRGDETAFASTNDVTPAGLLAAARDLVHAADADSGVTVALHAVPGRAWAVRRMPGQVPVAERIQVALAAERAARAAGPHVRQVTVYASGFEQRIGIARSDGQWCEDERVQVVLRVQAVAARDGMIQTGFESAGGTQGWELFEKQDPAEVGRRAGAQAERMLAARPAPSGRMPVVIAAEAGGTMIHEAIGHALEADLVQKGLSLFGDQLGRPVASALISVADDATLAGWRGSFGFDDEGMPAQRTLLVEKGVLRGFMTDRLTARRGNLPATGNGRRQSYAHRPIPRMTNTMILPGAEDPASILRSVPKGLYVVRMGGGQVNTVNGDFVFEITEGYLIRDGEQAEPVRGATLIGNAAEVLKTIDKVASDHGQGIGTCGKDGQGVPVADAQPTLRIPEITVGGSE